MSRPSPRPGHTRHPSRTNAQSLADLNPHSILTGSVKVSWTDTPPDQPRSLYSGVDLTTQHNYGYACPCGFIVTSQDSRGYGRWALAHRRYGCVVAEVVEAAKKLDDVEDTDA